ncbi:hypothetical protein ACUXPZ_001016 [Staphylococcus epidermidis]
MIKINAQGREISLFNHGVDDYISLTNIAKYISANPNNVIKTGYALKILLNF